LVKINKSKKNSKTKSEQLTQIVGVTINQDQLKYNVVFISNTNRCDSETANVSNI